MALQSVHSHGWKNLFIFPALFLRWAEDAVCVGARRGSWGGEGEDGGGRGGDGGGGGGGGGDGGGGRGEVAGEADGRWDRVSDIYSCLGKIYVKHNCGSPIHILSVSYFFELPLTL